MEEELTTGGTSPNPDNMSTEVTEPLAGAMEAEAPINSATGAAPETTELAPTSCSQGSSIAASSTTKSKLSKDFALNDKILFPIFSQEEQEKIFQVLNPVAGAGPTLADAYPTSTINMAPAPQFSSSGDPRIDFFFHLLEQTNEEMAVEMLANSWTSDALYTLKLVAHLRDVKEGKGIRRQYQYCLYWLYKNHPKTLYENLPMLIKLGYWKDALHFLMTILFNGYVHPYFAADDGVKDLGNIRERKPRGGGAARGGGRGTGGGQADADRVLHGRINRLSVTPGRKVQQNDDEKRIYNSKIMQHYKIFEMSVHQIRAKDMAALRLRFARERFASDPKYRAFHIRIAQIFAAQLQLDFAELGKLEQAGSSDDEKKTSKLNLSLVAKWAPTLEGHFDRYSLVASTIALEFAKLLKKDDILSKSSIPIAVYLARKFYNKAACIPLRTQLEIPEQTMSQGEWEKINYQQIEPKCMKLNFEHFKKHDHERFKAYMLRGPGAIPLKPIEFFRSTASMALTMTEAEMIGMAQQWKAFADYVKSKGSGLLSQAVAICDVSDSTCGDPMAAVIGLTLLAMNMCSAPWNDICITFNSQPKIHQISTSWRLADIIESMKEMRCGGRTCLQSVFKQIIDIGSANKLTASQMPKVLLVLTDKDYNLAFYDDTSTVYQLGKMLFQEKGYIVPTVVFWNLRVTPVKITTPVRVDEHGSGTLLLSGWSDQMLEYVIGHKDLAAVSPWSFVQHFLEKERYAELKVYD